MKWLHISDIHFNYKGFDSTNLKSKLLNKLKQLNLQLDFILISGDCQYQYNTNQTTQRKLITFIKQVGKTCNCPPNRIYICPGNHDVNRHDEIRNDLIDDIRAGKKDFSEHFNTLCDLGSEKFQAIYKGVTKKEYVAYTVYEPKGEFFRIVSANTCLLSKDKDDTGRLQICNEHLLQLNDKLVDDNKLNILIMHHSIDSLKDDDSRRFTHWIDDNHIDVIFSGHTHRAAVEVLDDTYREIKQITAGAIIVDGYALPSFYLCEFNADTARMNLQLYSYTTNQDDWVKDNSSLRRFKDGLHSFVIPRRSHQHSNQITNLDDIFDAFNAKYKGRYNSSKIYSNKFEGDEEFNSWKILNSLVNIGMPYKSALLITDYVIDEITQHKFTTSHDILSCFELRSVVYHAILQYAPEGGENSFDVSCWASKYARKYDRCKEILVVKDNGETEKLNYSYIKNTLLRQAIDSISGNPYYYRRMTGKELCTMAESILLFLKHMEVFEIKHEVLLALVQEYMTQKPHPWLVNNNRVELLKYHKEQAEKHIIMLQQSPLIISQLEAAYHICASFLILYGDFIGADETSPIIFLTNAINWIHDEHKFEINRIPVLRYHMVQLKKDLDAHGIPFNDFTQALNFVADKIIRERNVSDFTTRKELYKLWNYLVKLEESHASTNTLEYTTTKKMHSLFGDAIGFVAKSPLRALPKCFWVEPNWEKYESANAHLGSNILVCVLEDSLDVDSIFSYCFCTHNIKACTELVFVKSDLFPFSSEDRQYIRGKFSGHFVRCIFIQERNISQLQDPLTWRDTFLKIAKDSLIS